jgi:proteic killer suppression protein
MIRSFKDKEIEKVFARIFSRKLPQDIQQTAYRKLRMLINEISTRNEAGNSRYRSAASTLLR